MEDKHEFLTGEELKKHTKYRSKVITLMLIIPLIFWFCFSSTKAQTKQEKHAQYMKELSGTALTLCSHPFTSDTSHNYTAKAIYGTSNRNLIDLGNNKYMLVFYMNVTNQFNFTKKMRFGCWVTDDNGTLERTKVKVLK